jgi:hypothetical protein
MATMMRLRVPTRQHPFEHSVLRIQWNIPLRQLKSHAALQFHRMHAKPAVAFAATLMHGE